MCYEFWPVILLISLRKMVNCSFQFVCFLTGNFFFLLYDRNFGFSLFWRNSLQTCPPRHLLYIFFLSVIGLLIRLKYFSRVLLFSLPIFSIMFHTVLVFLFIFILDTQFFHKTHLVSFIACSF